MITPETLVPGKYYKVEYSDSTYLCQATKNDNVIVRWTINHLTGRKMLEKDLNGGVMGSRSIREISYSYYMNGEDVPLSKNSEAKSLLEKEW